MKGISDLISESFYKNMEIGGIQLSTRRPTYRFMVYDSNTKEVFVLQFEDVMAFIDEYGYKDTAKYITNLKRGESYYDKYRGIIYTNIAI